MRRGAQTKHVCNDTVYNTKVIHSKQFGQVVSYCFAIFDTHMLENFCTDGCWQTGITLGAMMCTFLFARIAV